jgi:hypothetical protein
MQLAGIPYDKAVDLERYNFVIGIAAQTSPFNDLFKRVVFDELRLGRFSREHQALYASLKGRSFDEVACHSNGGMICLAALANKDIVARHVVLYGPQITPESLMMYDQFVKSGQIRSLKIVVNQNDPVPPVAMLASKPERAIAAAFAPFAAAAMFTTPVLTRAISAFAPSAHVTAHPCNEGFSLGCHNMNAYKDRR